MRTGSTAARSVQTIRRGLVLFVAFAIVVLAATAGNGAGATERANVRDVDDNQAAAGARFSSISDDGTRVTFYSRATDLVEYQRSLDGRTNGANHVYVRDFETGKTTLVSVNNNGIQGNADSDPGMISGNGRWVVFSSQATNLLQGGEDSVGVDKNGVKDVFLRDLKKKKTFLISVTWTPRGKRIQGNGPSYLPAISDDGKEIAYVSAASNLYYPKKDNGYEDVFYFDRRAEKEDALYLVSDVYNAKAAGNGVSGGVIGDGNVAGVAIAGDGKKVAYGSTATNVSALPDRNGGAPDVYLWAGPNSQDEKHDTLRVNVDLESGLTEQGNGWSFAPSLNDNGNVISFWSNSDNLVSNDTNNMGDIFIADLEAYSTTRVNLDAQGGQDTGGALTPTALALSDDGTRVVFTTFGWLVEPGNCTGEQVYMRRRDTNVTLRVSETLAGACPDGYSNYAAISGNGQFVTFTSFSGNLVAGDTNNDTDVFRRGGY